MSQTCCIGQFPKHWYIIELFYPEPSQGLKIREARSTAGGIIWSLVEFMVYCFWPKTGRSIIEEQSPRSCLEEDKIENT